MSQNQRKDPTDNKEEIGNYGRQIGDTVRSALQSGDLTRLKNIAPAVQGIVKSATEVARAGKHTGAPQNQNHVPVNYQQYPPQQYGGLYPTVPPKNRQPAVRAKGPSSFTGVAQIALGITGAITCSMGLLAVGILSAIGMLGSGAVLLGGVLLGATALSAALASGGTRKRALASRIRQYYAMLAGKGVATFDQLAMTVKSNALRVKKDIRKAMRNDMMPDARIDKEETCIILGEDAYKLYLDSEQARREREAEEARRAEILADPQTAALERFKEEGASALARIRAANDAIPGKEVSAKIDTLELTAKKIFEYVRKRPEKLPDTQKLMSYYLPTTLKLLDKYNQYEKMEVQLPNVEKTKREIEESLDTINTAFNNLLESLYQDDTLDVSTDIEVLQTILKQEGLAGRRFTIHTNDKFESAFEEENGQ